MSDIAISVSNVSKCYRVFDNQRSRLLHAVWPRHTKGMQEVWALKDINFEIKRGESVAIIGRNGGGKSTLLEILTGTLTPTTGSVKVNGRISALLELGSGFNPEYSGRDNVILNGLLLGLSKDDILSRFGEIEAFAEIGAAIDRPVKTYSSGMMMRLAFAVQVLCDPDILIIDEALSVGDFFFQQKCLSFIRALCDQGVTLLFVSHDMGTVRNLCDRVIFLQKGKKYFDGVADNGIPLYLSQSKEVPTPSNLLHKAEIPEMKVTTAKAKHGIIKSPIWAAAEYSSVIEKTSILAVGSYDKDWLPATAFKIGQNINFLVLYKANCEKPVHVGVVIKNKYDMVVNVTTSYTLGVLPPKLKKNDISVFFANVTANLEGGEYSISFNLGVEGACANQGEKLFETPQLGPFHILWNYDQDVAPFYGICGIPVSAEFLSAGDAGLNIK